MMSLVAYGSSGESENESDNEVESSIEEEKPSVSKPSNGTLSDTSACPSSEVLSSSVSSSEIASNLSLTASVAKKTLLSSTLPPPKSGNEEVIEDIDSDKSLLLGSKLPAPKHHSTSSLLEGSIVATKDGRGKNKKGTVKIMIPSLSDFPDDKDVPKAKTKIQPSAKGSGLFALLPPPKQATVKETNRSLVPNVLTRKPTPAPPPKKVLPKAPMPSAKRKHPDSDPESDGEGDQVDFFSLNKEDKLPEIPIAEMDLMAASSNYQNPGASVAFEEPSTSYAQSSSYGDYQSNQYNQQMETDTPPQADSGQDFIGFSGNQDLQLDDEAIKKLCGRKGRNREEIQILDVSSNDIMPNQREWLTKQLTEEQPRHSSKSKLFGPSSQQKRKHQITYLAHIVSIVLAKENELELKNQWAHNRQTRKQTQSKYGF
ncbi:Proline-rich protein PRCC [Frankliniella fusca]|uniref:Proline-rich protein PRCC n=1 Tax=Frankliniella fusca TaxID=407009 RepID=A0AAE1HBE1_9NEOP|nr:Proline-rich protein PRCC [Frankliniella fusca]